MSASPSLVAFGSLARWPAQNQLHQLWEVLQHDKSFEPLNAAIRDLASLWQVLEATDSNLRAIAGKAASSELADVIQGIHRAQDVEEQRNTMTMPMTVIIQLVQYFSYLESPEIALDHESVVDSVTSGGGVQGLCAGLLTALAVAGGKTKGECIALAATSVKLAFCVGAYIDLDQSSENDSRKYSNLAVRCKEPVTVDEAEDMLNDHPETYTAVVRGTRDITVITPAASMAEVQEDLISNGASVLDTGIRGRYHTDQQEGVAAKIIAACSDVFDVGFADQNLVRSNADAQIIPADNAALVALECILADHADWHETISTSVSKLANVDGNPFILSVGANAILPSTAKGYPVVKVRTIISKPSRVHERQTSPTPPPRSASSIKGRYPQDAVAVIGMSCKLPGADSIDAFWEVLKDGRSMLAQMPEERFDIKNLKRSPKDLKFWGNFVQDIESFDHKFFKRSSREAAAMDPQQRLLLQATYHALESSGYFSDPAKPRHVGCYIGACATDYDANVASHPPSAYSTIGTLRAFLSGKISHNFGWSGPSLTFDTACSSSAVAIHTACTALRMGECSQAVAGGVALFTSPYLYENLATAHFLSPTGATKPFDVDADGYCRGEGVGLVVLKKYSDAIADGDNVLGVIAGSAINQNQNCVPITVPHASSQGNLYRQVAQQAGIVPQEVTFVEAHGTGTPVGDPIEMESIRGVFGGSKRDAPLFVSSVKGNIGHLEGASGVAGLIKALLQMEYRTACPQASFRKLNPKIPSLEVDKICVPTTKSLLPEGFVTACINNYGAAGSNSAMMLMQGPVKDPQAQDVPTPLAKYPFQIAASSLESLKRYCQALDEFCHTSLASLDDAQKLRLFASVAFSVARRQNQQLSYMLTLTATDINQLQQQLGEQISSNGVVKQRPKEKPAILCFGGQVGNCIALNKDLWQRSALFRSHLDLCDRTLRSLGFPGLYPSIFSDEAIDDIVTLQSAVFSTQYASAQTWIASGLKVHCVVGHSLGQFAALCISGTISLEDGLRLVTGRASLMQKHWGPESGTMIAIESESSNVEEITKSLTSADSSYAYEVACYNGPTSHVVVSDRASADVLEAELKKRSMRHRRLKVTHGFHSRFTDPLLPHLKDLASSLTFREATIPIETCTEGSTWSEATPDLLAAHTRDPVYFGEAIQRISDRLGSCTFLEAGSDSSVVSMARKALNQSTGEPHNYISVELNKANSLDKMVDLTIDLWNLGHQFQFWMFHRLQTPEYDVLRLPSYIFEKSKHWLELKVEPLETESLGMTSASEYSPPAPAVLIRLENTSPQGRTFEIGPRSAEYQKLVKGHAILGRAQAPLSFYVELLSRAVRTDDGIEAECLLSVEELSVQSPLDHDTEREIRLFLHDDGDGWRFEINSRPTSSGGTRSSEGLGAQEIRHVTGLVVLRRPGSATKNEFARYERLIGQDNFAAVLNNVDGTTIKGPMVYKVFSELVDYADFYRNVRSVASDGTIVVGKVNQPEKMPEDLQDTISKPHILDSFFQVASMQLNCIYESSGDDMFWLSGVDRIQFGSGFHAKSNDPSVPVAWDVLCYVSEEDGKFAHDIFVYDEATGTLALLILGARYTNIKRASLALASDHDAAIFFGATVPRQDAEPPREGPREKSLQEVASGEVSPEPAPTVQKSVAKEVETKPQKVGKDPKVAIFDDFATILEKVAEVPKSEVKGGASFDDMGVDSLMMMEVVAEVSTFFKADLPVADLEQLTDVDSLVNYLHGRGCKGTDSGEPVEEQTGGNSSDSSSLTDGISTNDLVSTPDSSQYEDSSSSSPTPKLPDDSSASTAELEKPKSNGQAQSKSFAGSQQAFEDIRFDGDKYCEQTKFNNFWKDVYPEQAHLVESYIIESFRNLGCDLTKVSKGEQLPPLQGVPEKHSRLIEQLRKILLDGNIVELNKDKVYVRTAKPLDPTSSTTLYERLVQKHPQHSAEMKLLSVTASRFAECLTDKINPLQLLFANSANRKIMADVYENAPMCQATTRLLSDFLLKAFSADQSGEPFQILEVGAGTGGTSKYIVDLLIDRGVKFEYTFTDISSALVSQAKKLFPGKDMMRYMTLDCDKAPPNELCGKYDVVIATNCIHATHDASTSSGNVARLLHDRGMFCLVEFTNGLYWFDLVYGLLEGWWFFSDGRQHALADQWFWDSALKSAGFKHVSWTDGKSSEAKTMRVICGFPSAAEDESFKPVRPNLLKRAGMPTQTFVFKKEGNVELEADVYFPKSPDGPSRRRPIALMIHGGGHLLFGRRDIPMKHVRVLIQRGYLPVSVDYRLCPELSLYNGPVTDCRDALRWVRERLPSLELCGPRVAIEPEKVLALGWSSGGQLAMTLGYGAQAAGIKPPDVILPFYSPSDLEAEFWSRPIFPEAAEEPPQEIWGELDCVRREPILEYTPMSDKRATALSLTLKDDRARLILHMNWTGQSVNVLVRGLPYKDDVSADDKTDYKNLPPPPVEKVRECSPYYHIIQGSYKTPTFMVHGNVDDWIPYQMTQKTIAALQERNVPSGVIIADQCGHAFDLFPKEDRLGVGWDAIEAAYDFAGKILSSHP